MGVRTVYQAVRAHESGVTAASDVRGPRTNVSEVVKLRVRRQTSEVPNCPE